MDELIWILIYYLIVCCYEIKLDLMIWLDLIPASVTNQLQMFYCKNILFDVFSEIQSDREVMDKKYFLN